MVKHTQPTRRQIADELALKGLIQLSEMHGAGRLNCINLSNNFGDKPFLKLVKRRVITEDFCFTFTCSKSAIETL